MRITLRSLVVRFLLSSMLRTSADRNLFLMDVALSVAIHGLCAVMIRRKDCGVSGEALWLPYFVSFCLLVQI